MKTIINCFVPLLRNITRRKASNISMKHESDFEMLSTGKYYNITQISRRKDSFMLHATTRNQSFSVLSCCQAGFFTSSTLLQALEATINVLV